MKTWIQKHRLRAFKSVFHPQYKEVGEEEFIENIVKPMEKDIVDTAMKSREGKSPTRFPPDPERSSLQAFFFGLQQKFKPKETYRLVAGERTLRIAGMATMPSRADSVAKAIDSLLPHVDRLYLFCDRFEECVVSEDPKVIIIRSQEFGDMRAAGNLFGLLMSPGCYYFTVDDDIIYPPDYVETMVSFLKKHNNAIVAGVHGAGIRKDFQRYSTGLILVHRSASLPRPGIPTLVGTDTTAFHTDLLSFDAREWEHWNMVDLQFALECKKRDISLLLIPREKGWITCIEEDQPDSIWMSVQRDDSVQTTLARKLVS